MRKYLWFGGLLYPLFFTYPACAVDDTAADPAPSYSRPLDVGFGVGLGDGPDKRLYGLDYKVGKRIINLQDWGIGVQYHHLGGDVSGAEVNSAYATVAMLDSPLEFKLGYSRVSVRDGSGKLSYDTGASLGFGLLSNKDWVDDQLRVHFLDYQYISTPRGSYSVWSLSFIMLKDI